MAIVSMKALLETGVHFGHRTRRWNPKMNPYIFTERNGIHILDLQQTIHLLDEAHDAIRDTVANGGEVLFVGTKRQAQDTTAAEATRARQPYVTDRWLGGTLTNWRTIRERINYLNDLEARRDAGEFDALKKTERLRIEREIDKLNQRLGGIREMNELPDLLFVTDVNHEETAVKEANKLGIPVIGIVDTNSDPDPIDYVIPSNDDAIRAIKLIVGKMADAALEGKGMRKDDDFEEEVVDFEHYGPSEYGEAEEAGDEVLLGESTLAKMQEAREAAELAAAEAEKARLAAAAEEALAAAVAARAEALEAEDDAVVAEAVAEEAVAEAVEAEIEAEVADVVAEEVVAEALEAEADDLVAEAIVDEAVVEAVETEDEAVVAEIVAEEAVEEAIEAEAEAMVAEVVAEEVEAEAEEVIAEAAAAIEEIDLAEEEE